MKKKKLGRKIQKKKSRGPFLIIIIVFFLSVEIFLLNFQRLMVGIVDPGNQAYFFPSLKQK